MERKKNTFLFLLFFIVIVAFLTMYFMQWGPFNDKSTDAIASEVREPSYTTARVAVGNTIRINAEGTDQKLIWSSSDSSIASVDDGVVTGIKQGTVMVTVYVEDKLVAKCEVTVYGEDPIDSQQPQEDEEVQLILPESISIDQTDVSLTVGETRILVATILPENTSDNVVNWSSSDDKIVSVLNGEVTANSVGTAIITASTNNGKTTSVTVTVKEKEIAGIRLNKSSATIVVGSTVALKAYSTPDNILDNSVSWTSSNSGIATVNKGIVTGKKTGKATITAKTSNGKTASATINVIAANAPKKPVSKIVLKPETTTLTVGRAAFIDAVLSPDNATNTNITWSSSNKDIVEVVDGFIYGNKGGKAVITAKTSNGLSASVTITVKEIMPTSISLNKKEITLKIGSQSTLVATVLPNEASNKAVTWRSSNTDIATVEKGVVTAKKAGKANISATTHNGHTTLCVVNVKPIEVTAIKLNASAGNINVGKTVQLTATITPSNATNKTVTWKSSNTGVATVSSSGLVTAKAAGTANITASSNNGLSAIYKATVVIPVSGVTIKLSDKAVTTATTTVGSSVQFTAVVSPSNATNKTVTWKSSNTKIATVNSAGKVSAKRTGTVNITATSGGKTATVKLTINGHRVHFINLGTSSGDAIILESNGHFAMVDTGGGSTAVRTKVENYINSLGVSTFDFMIITHKHSDHIGNAEYLASKFTFKKLYIKHYIGKDLVGTGQQDAWNKAKERYNVLVQKTFGGKTVFVDTDAAFKETTSSSGYVSLGAMKVYFYNTRQRMKDLPSGKTNKYPSYYSESYWAGTDENNNSLVNLVKVNGHNVLLTGDMTNKDVWDSLLKDRINGKLTTIAIFKVPHHAVYNCVGTYKTTDAVDKLRFNLTSKVTYYQVSGTVSDKRYDTGKTSTSETRRSCFNVIAKGNNTNAKKLMCGAYYSTESTNANVYNLSGSTVGKPSGNGLGSANSSLCK